MSDASFPRHLRAGLRTLRSAKSEVAMMMNAAFPGTHGPGYVLTSAAKAVSLLGVCGTTEVVPCQSKRQIASTTGFPSLRSGGKEKRS